MCFNMENNLKNSDCYKDIMHTLVGKIDMNILFSYKHKSDRDFSYKETQFKRIHE